MNQRKSKHCRVRQQQRGIPNQVIDWLLLYGEERRVPGGASKLFFSKQSLKEMRSELGKTLVSLSSKYWNIALIVSADDKAITTYWSIHQ
mgnify:CR=1 FL=1